MNKKRILSVIIFCIVLVIALVISAINLKKGTSENDNTAENFASVENQNTISENTIGENATELNKDSENLINNAVENNQNQSNTQSDTTTQSKENIKQEQAVNNQEKRTEEQSTNVANPYNLDKKIFLLDIENYNPSSDVKISENQAKRIAQNGFDESKKRIAGEGADDVASEIVKIETVSPNNYFTRYGREHDKIYTNKKRKCYVITRENDMGNGIKIYVDVTTGLIIGGSAFGD